MPNLNTRSLTNLIGVHTDLQRVVLKCAQDSAIAFIVTDGLRTLAEQQELLRQKRTKTLRSRHLTGHAIDVAVVHEGKVTWDFFHYLNLSKDMKKAAEALGVEIQWGGDWKTFKDGPHYELTWEKYP